MKFRDAVTPGYRSAEETNGLSHKLTDEPRDTFRPEEEAGGA